jgi:hypothetical protein
MKISFCTLFDSFYLDKGLTMYQSLVDCGCDFELYILAMNDTCYDILTDMHLEGVIPIALEEFMDEELRRVKRQRSRAEFCWTCSSCLISYVLRNFSVDMCTYIDADLYFYNNPVVLLEEFLASGKSVSVIEHRFDNSPYSAELKKNSGKYCVQFNTFKNNEKAHRVLDDWKEQCLKSCTSDADGENFGDQKYQDTWMEDYDCVYETASLGAGIAPWNVSQYRYAGEKTVRKIGCSEDIPLIFYHFHMIHYLSESMVDINVFTRSGHAQKKLVYGLYQDYLARIEQKRAILVKKYGMDYTVHPNTEESKKKISIRGYLNRNFFSKVYMKIHSILNKKKDYISIQGHEGV